MDNNPIKDVRLQTCCIEQIGRINSSIKSGNMLQIAVVALPVFKAFFYPTGASQLASLSSTAMSISTEDWMLLARDVQMVDDYTRRMVYDIAFTHHLKHARDNNYKLQKFWEGVADAFFN